jgi:hypothetical protein
MSTNGAQSRMSINEVPGQISRIFFGDKSTRYDIMNSLTYKCKSVRELNWLPHGKLAEHAHSIENTLNSSMPGRYMSPYSAWQPLKMAKLNIEHINEHVTVLI